MLDQMDAIGRQASAGLIPSLKDNLLRTTGLSNAIMAQWAACS